MVNELLLVATSFVGLSVFLLFFAIRNPHLAAPIFVAFSARIFVLILSHIFLTLPDSTNDAVAFENVAYEWSKLGFSNVVSNYPGPNSYFISWVIGLLYSLLGRSELFSQSISVWMGMGICVMGTKLAGALWGRTYERKTLWILSIAPWLITYSCLVLRESYVAFFTLVSCFYVIKFYKINKYYYIIASTLSLLVAGHFHGVMMLGIPLLLILWTWRTYSRILPKIWSNGVKRIFSLPVTIIVILVIIYISYTLNVFIPKLGSVGELSGDRFISAIANRSLDSSAAYPTWLTPTKASDLLTLFFPRLIYFAFSPFIWDVNKFIHIFGLIDGIMYIYCFSLIFRNYKTINLNSVAIILLLVLLFYFILFSFGVGNFGAGIRHRTKFLPILVCVIVPFVPNIRVINNRH